MIALIRKEWMQLRPIAAFWLALTLIGLVFIWFEYRIDELHFRELCEEYCGWGVDYTTTVIYALLAIIVAYSLFPREHDESTIDFLKALPIGKVRIFIAKVLAAWLLIVMLIFLQHVVIYLLSVLRIESIDGKNYPWITVSLIWREWVFAFVLLSHGVFLSWFRTAGLIMYAAYLTALFILERYDAPVGPFNVLRIMANEYDGQRLLVATETIITQAAIAAGLFVVSYFLWSRTESKAADISVGGRSRPWISRVATVAGFAVVGLVMLGQMQGQEYKLAGSNLKTEQTDHYRFVYDPARESTVNYLVEHADDDLQRLAGTLGADTEALHIQADLTSNNAHAAGLALWKKIKVNLDSFDTDSEQRRVISHETAHVFQSVLSNRRINNHANAANFLVEGMAQQLSFNIIPQDKARARNWRNAAVATARQNIQFEDLVDAARFSTTFDAELVYSVGDMWAEAMVTTCGDDVFGDWLRAIGRPEAATDLPARVFWNDSMQFIECDISAVNRRWRELAAEVLAGVDQDLYPEFNNVGITLDDTGSSILVTAEATSDKPISFRVRVSDPVTFGKVVDPIFTGRIIDDNGIEPVRVEFRIPRRVVSGSRFQFQLGVMAESGARIYFDRWQGGSISSE